MLPGVAKIWKSPFRRLTFELNKGTVSINRIYCYKCKGSCSENGRNIGTLGKSVLANKLLKVKISSRYFKFLNIKISLQ
jgi:hypothetical protein